jgi:hypothetical protein
VEVVRKLKLIPMVCKICNKHYGRFNPLHAWVAQMAIALKPEQTENDAASDSSILLSIVQIVAFNAYGTSSKKKRERATYEAEKEELQDEGE